MSKIIKIQGLEIVDSRGNPTVRCKALLDDGSIGIASVPSGASVGRYEAVELRDGDKERHGGKGTLNAVKNINEKMQSFGTAFLIYLTQHSDSSLSCVA